MYKYVRITIKNLHTLFFRYTRVSITQNACFQSTVAALLYFERNPLPKTTTKKYTTTTLPKTTVTTTTTQLTTRFEDNKAIMAQLLGVDNVTPKKESNVTTFESTTHLQTTTASNLNTSTKGTKLLPKHYIEKVDKC